MSYINAFAEHVILVLLRVGDASLISLRWSSYLFLCNKALRSVTLVQGVWLLMGICSYLRCGEVDEMENALWLWGYLL